MKKYKLVADVYFQDKYDESISYEVGSYLITDDLNRVKDLQKRGLAYLEEVIEDTIIDDENNLKYDKNKEKEKKLDKDVETKINYSKKSKTDKK